MADIVNAETRSRMMSGIRGTNTKPELRIRRILHSRGFRFRIHVSSLPGRPDIVLPKFKAAILVHGCFWHGHSCALFKWPSSRADFWRTKIETNRVNDQKAIDALRNSGWRIAIIWECSTKGHRRFDDAVLGDMLESWLRGGVSDLEVPAVTI